MRPDYDDTTSNTSNTSNTMNNLYYSAPEQIDLEPDKATFKFDSWAAGVFLFEMSQGKHPFRGKNFFETR